MVDVDFPKAGLPDSRDELDTLLGHDSIGRSHLVHEARRLALRQGPWKFIPPARTREQLGPWKTVEIKGPGFLFDVSVDPRETNNLAEKQPAKLTEMAKLLSRIRNQPDR